jgi:hypothetical protein
MSITTQAPPTGEAAAPHHGEPVDSAPLDSMPLDSTLLDSTPLDSTPLTAVAVIAGTLGIMVDALTELDQMIGSFTAVRTVAIDEIHQLALAAESCGSKAGKSGPLSWSATVTARRVAATEVCAALRISEREAEQMIADSHALVHQLPLTLDALRTGRISYRHASILVDETRSLPEESWHAFESVALPEAEVRTPAGFRQRARALRERQHPTSIDERRREAEEWRSVRLEPGRDGMAWLSAHLPAEQAHGAYHRLTEIAASLAAPDEPRTLAQRRADVFADLLIDGITPDTGLGRGVRATVLVTVPVLTLLDSQRSGYRIVGHNAGECSGHGTGNSSDLHGGAGLAVSSLEGYGPIGDEVARRLAAHAPSFVRLLTHPETGTVLSVGRERYAVPRDLKLWLRIRDETCRFPGCGRAAASSDIDHTIDWQHNGATRHDNLAHLCRSHHQLKHNTAWQVSQVGGGTLEWRAPSGKRYRTTPAIQLTGNTTPRPYNSPAIQPAGNTTHRPRP